MQKISIFFWSILIASSSLFFHPQYRIYWLYLLSAYFIALGVYLLDKTRVSAFTWRGFLSYCFPKSVYLHPSAIVDYFYVFFNQFLFFILIIPFLWLMQTIAGISSNALEQAFGPVQITLTHKFAISLFYSLLLTVVSDGALYLVHYMAHKIPALWQFHKVHHSAEVMTPITVFRMHPVDDILSLIVVALFTGTIQGLFVYLFMDQIFVVTAMGVNVFIFLFYVLGYNLRHSHLWFSYGPFWSKIFISPAQHQIHHSNAVEHRDKNMGFMFAFWDSITKSLVVPDRKLNLEFGLSHGEAKEFSSALKLFYLPFLKLFGRGSKNKDIKRAA